MSEKASPVWMVNGELTVQFEKSVVLPTTAAMLGNSDELDRLKPITKSPRELAIIDGWKANTPGTGSTVPSRTTDRELSAGLTLSSVHRTTDRPGPSPE